MRYMTLALVTTIILMVAGLAYALRRIHQLRHRIETYHRAVVWFSRRFGVDVLDEDEPGTRPSLKAVRSGTNAVVAWALLVWSWARLHPTRIGLIAAGVLGIIVILAPVARPLGSDTAPPTATIGRPARRGPSPRTPSTGSQPPPATPTVPPAILPGLPTAAQAADYVAGVQIPTTPTAPKSATSGIPPTSVATLPTTSAPGAPTTPVTIPPPPTTTTQTCVIGLDLEPLLKLCVG